MEEYWAYWSRYIWINRYSNPPAPTYNRLLELVKDKDYFVLTTNVDHCFQKAGFDKKRIFYTQSYQIDTTGELTIAEGIAPKRAIPSELVPHCPHCGKPLTMNLRADDTFVEDEGWHQAAERYYLFRQRHEKLSIVYLELGVGYNTPVLRSLSTRRKLRKNMVKQQIQGYLFNKSTKYGERRCA